MNDARKPALELYKGYEFREREVLNVSLRNRNQPKYLRQELLTDPTIMGDLTRHYAKIQTSRLKTPARSRPSIRFAGASFRPGWTFRPMPRPS